MKTLNNTVRVCFVILIVGIITGILLIFSSKDNKKKGLTIAILQTASHPALDQVRENFIQELQKIHNSPISFIEQNAEGIINTLQLAAKKFHFDPTISTILTIATPATQAMCSIEKNKPIILAAVSDPSALGIMHNTSNITGVCDLVDTQQLAASITMLFPHIKTAAILHNPSEVNSLSCAHKIKKSLNSHTISTIDVGVSSEAEVATATHLACRKADIIVIPTDNTLATSIKVVTTIATKTQVPVVVCDNLLVKEGALCSAGSTNYAEAGKRAAHIAYNIITQQKNPHEIPFQQAIDQRIFINQQVATQLGLSWSSEIKKQCVFINP